MFHERILQEYRSDDAAWVAEVRACATGASAGARISLGGFAKSRLNHRLFSLTAGVAEYAATLSAVILAQVCYTGIAYGQWRILPANFALGVVAASSLVAQGLLEGSYAVQACRKLAPRISGLPAVWNSSYLTAALVAFLTRSALFSRGSFVVFYFVGAAFLLATRAAVSLFARRAVGLGGELAERILLVGPQNDVERRRSSPAADARHDIVMGTHPIPESPGEAEEGLASALEAARKIQPDRIVIAASQRRCATVDACIAAFLNTPFAISVVVGNREEFDRFAGATIEHEDHALIFQLRRDDTSRIEASLKRVFDVVLGVAALIILAPLLAMIALAIKLDSPGPILFHQTRVGLHRRTFRIAKFRTLAHSRSTSDLAGRRPTRFGRILRKTNLDELPQLFNVLRGEMSLIGPRPHAVADDVRFSKEFPLYGRRRLALPGMTGWAQVNGHRGLTDTPAKLRKRVEHDIHYVENRSFFFDLWILALTVFSTKSYLYKD